MITYPAELPVSQRRDDIAAAIRDHQVVIVAGETGSGKTTQLPKICLELGRGVSGLIGHTQPRRIAARTVAERIAEELGTQLGDAVGYKVRFTDQVGDQTPGQADDRRHPARRDPERPDAAPVRHVIIDEAHERSLNIDFILGYLRQLLPAPPRPQGDHHLGDHRPRALRPALRRAAHRRAQGCRADRRGLRPDVPGRGALPAAGRGAEGDEDETATTSENVRDQIQAICDAVDELAAEGPGDILVFLSGEREIRDTADALRKLVETKRALLGTEILPLYARLSTAEQHRVFQPHTGRRVVLATNVAETSLTVPGIKYVVDPGTARISRYSHRLKVQRLPIEPVSQASANQRKGRCGRTSDGICIRLYAEAGLRLPARSSPTRRSCAPTSPRSSCR